MLTGGCRSQDTFGEASALGLVAWLMLAGAVALFAIASLFFTVTGSRVWERTRNHFLGGGIVLPSLVLASLLVWGLSALPDSREPGKGLRIRVTGEQWWWRVEYWPDGATRPVVSANEIRLPARARTEVFLTSGHVLHALWIPALGSRVDMVPGRVTRLGLRPSRPGVYRGQCAEFCGESHIWMSFDA